MSLNNLTAKTSGAAIEAHPVALFTTMPKAM
jgi:hypothetical protein